MKFLAGYLMRGPTQAILVTSVTAMLSLLLPPLSYLSGAAAGLVTLRLGAWRGLTTIAGAAAAVALLALAIIRSPIPGPAYLVAVWLPMWALAMSLRFTVSLEKSMLLASAFGGLLVAAIHGSVQEPALFWQKIFEDLLRQAGQETPLPAEMQEAYALMTGAMAAGVTLSLWASLFIARWWQALLYNPGGFQREFHALRFGRKLGLATLAVAGVALYGGPELEPFAGDLVMVFVVLHLLHGVAVVHGLVARSGGHVAWLVGLYALLLVAAPPTAITLSAVGFADAWFDFRSFFGMKREEG